MWTRDTKPGIVGFSDRKQASASMRKNSKTLLHYQVAIVNLRRCLKLSIGKAGDGGRWAAPERKSTTWLLVRAADFLSKNR